MKATLSSKDLKEPPVKVDGLHTIIVEDDFGNPIFVAVHQSAENIWVTTPEDPKFESLVKDLGITKRVVIQREN